MSTTRNLRPLARPELGADETSTSLIRDRIAYRSQRMDARYPEVLDLEARAVAAFGAAINGHAEALRGVHSGDHFRQITRGEHPITLAELLRLARSENPTGRRAFGVVLEALAAAGGYRLEVATVPVEAMTETLCRVIRDAAAVVETGARATSDGHVDHDEAGEILDRIAPAERALASLKQSALKVRGGIR